MPDSQFFNEGTIDVSLVLPDGDRSGASKTVHLRLPAAELTNLLHQRESRLRDAISGGGTVGNIESAAHELSHTLDALTILRGTRDWELRSVDPPLPTAIVREDVEEETPGATRCVTCGHTYVNHRSPEAGGCRVQGCDCNLFMGGSIPSDQEQADRQALEHEGAITAEEEGGEVLRTPIRRYVAQFAAEIEMVMNQAEEEWEMTRLLSLGNEIEEQTRQLVAHVNEGALEMIREQALQVGMLAAVLFDRADSELTSDAG